MPRRRLPERTASRPGRVLARWCSCGRSAGRRRPGNEQRGSRGIREAITYQPASRYWRFQLTETAIYLALALALAGYCLRRLSRPS